MYFFHDEPLLENLPQKIDRSFCEKLKQNLCNLRANIPSGAVYLFNILKRKVIIDRLKSTIGGVRYDNIVECIAKYVINVIIGGS